MKGDPEQQQDLKKSDAQKPISLQSSFKKYIPDWEISGYAVTNSISSGAFLLLFVGLFLNHILKQPFMTVRPSAIYTGTIISLLFLVITAILISRDIEDFSKFWKGLLNPIKGSRFVFGAYTILIFGILVTFFAITIWFKWKAASIILIYFTAVAAFLVSLSTTYLIDQRKNVNQWNMFILKLHVLVHSFMAGGAAYSIADAFFRIGNTWGFYVDMVLHTAIICNILVHAIEIAFTRGQDDQGRLVSEITTGEFKHLFWIGNVFIGNLLPFILIYFSDIPIVQTIAGIFIIVGIWIRDRIWITAPKYLNA